jgi:hypothetical protein
MKLLHIIISMEKIFLFILISGIGYFISCSRSLYCTDTEYIYIEYYSEGGFTGGAAGVTIDSSGTANFWEKNLNSQRKNIKVVKIEDEKLDRICNLLKDSAVFSYKNNFKGNYTTYLIIRLNGQDASISFNKSELPEDMPKAIKELLSELNNINN